MLIFHCLHCKNENIRELTKQIIKEQQSCEHEFGKEWQEYNFYKKRCKKCAYIQSIEY
jgi:hypothetical protein